MSSKILHRSECSDIAPIAWRRAEHSPDAGAGNITHFQPAKSVVSTEVAALRSRIAELESSAPLQAADAHRRGLREGETLGKAQAQAALEPVLERMAQTTRDLLDLRPRLRRDAESDVVQLAISIARRILHRELSLDPSAMQALVQVALGRMDRQEVHRVWVHPSQAVAVKATLAGEGREVEVISDARRELGSLLFETNRGKLDASVGAQFEEIERGLTDRVNQR